MAKKGIQIGMSPVSQKQMAAAMQRVRRRAEALAKQMPLTLRAVGEEIMTDIKDSRPGKGVPKDTGVLASTGRVEMDEQGRMQLSFGGPAAPYALIQHEALHFQHRVGEPRYLIRGYERWAADGGKVGRRLRELTDTVTKE